MRPRRVGNREPNEMIRHRCVRCKEKNPKNSEILRVCFHSKQARSASGGVMLLGTRSRPKAFDAQAIANELFVPREIKDFARVQPATVSTITENAGERRKKSRNGATRRVLGPRYQRRRQAGFTMRAKRADQSVCTSFSSYI